MKRNNFKFLYFFSLGFFITFVSCATKNVDSNIEVGLNKEIQNLQSDDNSESENKNVINKDDNPVEFKIERRQNSFLSNFGTESKFCEYDTLKVYASTAFGKIKNTDAVMVYVPESETFGFGSNYLAAYYYVHFDEEGRNAFIKAVNDYFKDFENKRLQRNNSKTTSIYGSTDVHVNWGSIKASCSNNGTGKIYFGYKFVDRSPYFTVSFSHIYNKRFDNDNVAPMESLNVMYFFTKEYCKNMALDLTDASVNSVLREYRGLNSSYSESDDIDEY